jgi:integrase
MLDREETALRSFVRYTLDLAYDGPLTRAIALDWICRREDASDKTKARRLEVLVPFAKYVVAFDSEAQVLPNKLFGNPHTRVIPYLYTEAETPALREGGRKLYSLDGLRSLTIATAIGLLVSTGLRTSELTSLKIKDVDLSNNQLSIWNSKFKKDSMVPISPSAVANLSEYHSVVSHQVGQRNRDAHFFVTTGGKPLTTSTLQYAFKILRNCIAAEPVGHPAVRLTDFRHTFASRTIASWLRDGQDVNASILYLSTYLGHAKPQNTYWYLSATPEMLNLACSRYEVKFGGGVCHE